MALNKVTYTDDVTVIEAQNLNDIQDEIIDNTVPKDTGGTFGGNVQIDRADGTTSTVGTSTLRVGNDTPTGTDGNSKGRVIIYGEGNKYANIQASSVTGNQTLELPNTSGTLMTNKGGTINGAVAIDEHNGTTSSVGASHLTLGNSIASGTAGNSTASLTMYGRQSYYTALYTAETLTANRSIYFPDAGGTVALEAQTGASGNSQYTKFPDGTLMQWGIAGQYASSNRADVAITMPLAFVNSSYSVFANGEIGDDANNYEVLIVIQRNTSQKFTAHIRNVTGNYIRQFNWLAIGRWK